MTMADEKRELERLAAALYQRTPQQLTVHELHTCLARTVLRQITPAWTRSSRWHATHRRAYYLSAEYLVGRAIYNNLLCTGLTEPAAGALQALGRSLGELEQIEDAALGNGGLGRLAACYLDSAATLGLPLDGYGIRYRYGIFRQEIREGFQQEAVDDWTRYGDPWSVRREDEAVTVSFGDGDVRAVPYDMPVIGYGGHHVSTLRLWQCEPQTPFDLSLFNEQQYDRAVRRKNRAEDISRVLYPNDSTPAGRQLRLRQQVFFCSASLQDMLRRFEAVHGPDWEELPRQITVQLNDTHPVIAVPELIRLLQARGVPFGKALAAAREIFNYTNHTIMPEALERWDMATVRRVCPGAARVIRQIAGRQRAELRRRQVPQELWPQLLLLQGSTVHMAYLACYCSRRVNGVAALHTDILRHQVLPAWNALYPDKLLNVTNGITQRRWLALADPPLAALLTRLLGDDGWITDLDRLQSLTPYADDPAVLQAFIAIKQQNKQRLCDFCRQRRGLHFDPERLLDVQVKRLHEYKRQLLNALCLLELYYELREGSLTGFTPTTVLFAAKAAPGYARAKAIIKLIHAVGALIAGDARVSRLLEVVFVPDYDMTCAEHIVAAADISEQISTAGTEASGTGNMKLMLNGAITLGTYDGANVEIVEAAGEENEAIFGARVEELERLRETYRARDWYEQDARLRRCLDALVDGTLDDGGTGMFRELYTALLDGADWHPADHYFLLADFDRYLAARVQLNREYGQDRLAFAARQWRNVCAAGRFSSDRAVAEYAEAIWRIRPNRRGRSGRQSRTEE